MLQSAVVSIEPFEWPHRAAVPAVQADDHRPALQADRVLDDDHSPFVRVGIIPQPLSISGCRAGNEQHFSW